MVKACTSTATLAGNSIASSEKDIPNRGDVFFVYVFSLIYTLTIENLHDPADLWLCQQPGNSRRSRLNRLLSKTGSEMLAQLT